MAVKVGDSKSKSHTLDMGVQQGSVVAPTLFSIMLHDIQRVGLKLMTLPSGQIAQPTRASDATRWNDFDSP